ncbi:type VI secretion system ATPase TssH [Paludibacterium purpuratum]|uniref:Type VI secretion system protein VasG n=1 Tax=Paludibacterium purpuratum TaxID=1144873 RepID=A0A4R7B595_9NEIS|nr:type VI secretion system ATPase TssH [Paludibacterium purpuratum]TDR79834.1 type VI secretion system protein VasG [Paludibacterium purpuratum]
MSISVKALVSKLTPVARQCVEQAASRALARSHFEVEIEHVLLAMLDGDGNAARSALSAVAAPIDRMETELDAALDGFRSGNTRNPVLSAWLPKWLEKAWLAASTEFGQDRVSTLDMLLALLADDALRAAVQQTVPSLLRVDAHDWRRGYAELRRHGSEAGEGEAPAEDESAPVGAAPTGRKGAPGLDKYTIDLTAQARAGKIDTILGRDSEIRQMIDILMRRRQNNPILTGEPGVGKTAVVEGLALKIAQGEVPDPLKGVTLRTLDLGLLQAGASVKGEFENRLRQVIDEVKASPVPIILFIDEAHTLIGAGGAAGQNDAANLLKPALARGELRTIAATTWAEYKKYFEKDAALARRFQVVKVDEPHPDVAVQMVRGLRDAMASHHQVTILEEAISAAVHLSSRYIPGRQLPDKAISVLDTACARVALSRAAQPAPIEDVSALIANIEREIAALSQEEGHGERLETLATRQTQLQQDLDRLHVDWQAQRELVAEIDGLREARADKPASGKKASPLQQKRQALRALHKTQPLAFECVDENVIADVISGWTGIPLGRMVSNELGQVRRLDALLAERVIGQDHALAQIAERVKIAKANLEDPGKPKGVFLLVGPSGVGKTETALALAEALYGGERSLITINMSEYQEAHSVSGLKGSPPGYVGYGEGGVLTEAVRRKPYSVVLLDEVEKAHPDVLELFFQVFDKGVLEDSEGRVVDFKNTIILLTSNAGSDLVMRACEHGVTVEDVTRDPTAEDLIEILRPTLQKTFKPAFLGRLSIIPYFPIGDEVLRGIVALKLEKIRQRIADNHGAQVEFPEALVDLLAARCLDVDSGARDADAILTRTVLARISNDVLDRMASGKPVKKIVVTLKDDQLKLRLS